MGWMLAFTYHIPTNLILLLQYSTACVVFFTRFFLVGKKKLGSQMKEFELEHVGIRCENFGSFLGDRFRSKLVLTSSITEAIYKNSLLSHVHTGKPIRLVGIRQVTLQKQNCKGKCFNPLPVGLPYFVAYQFNSVIRVNATSSSYLCFSQIISIYNKNVLIFRSHKNLFKKWYIMLTYNTYCSDLTM